MQAIQITDHARVRIQQRGIPEDVLPFLFKYGKKMHDKRGGKVLYLDKSGRERIRRECDQQTLNRLSDKLDVYAVLNENLGVITVGHRYRRITRH